MELCIMVVDDDAVFRESVQRHLGARYRYIFSETLNAARIELSRTMPDCVLLDYRLPDGEGISLVPELVSAQVPVVMCTARGSESLAVQALKEGADDYLAKSALKEFELTRAIDNAIERGRLRALVLERDHEKDALITQLQKALKDVDTLRGMIPICACCKKIRDDDGYWQGVEQYIGQHTQASFSHSYCPTCYAKELENMDAMREEGE